MKEQPEKRLELADYCRINREAWNEVVPIHRQHRNGSLMRAVQDPHFNMLERFEVAQLRQLRLEGRAVAQLCCNNGIELISILKLGARYGLGIDISDEAIAEAKGLARLAGVNVEFVRANLYDLGDLYRAQFDLVYLSAGSFFWLPDLEKAFQVVASMLRPGGLLFICDLHPFINMLTEDIDQEYDVPGPPVIRYPYFRSQPLLGRRGMDYIGQVKYDSKPNYKFLYTLSSLFNAISKNGISILEFEERSFDLSRMLGRVKAMDLPLCYTLTGKKL